MKNTRRGWITVKNILHGLVTAVLGAVISGVSNGIATGQLDIKIIGIGASSAGLAYLGKKLAENENGELISTYDQK